MEGRKRTRSNIITHRKPTLDPSENRPRRTEPARTPHRRAAAPHDLREVSIAREPRQVRGRQAVIRRQEVVDLAVVPLGRDGFGEHERRREGRDRAGGAVGREVLAVAAAGDGPVSATG
jgi:hypothetical protein